MGSIKVNTSFIFSFLYHR